MLNLTRKADYALVALAYLSQRREDAGGPVSAREIASRFTLPLPFLMNLLKRLVQGGLVTSTRGSSGGYELAMDPGEITLMRVLNEVEGPVRFARCADTLPVLRNDCEEGQGCPIAEHCPIRGPIRRLHERICGFLEGVTLADLADDPGVFDKKLLAASV